jgi:hypothetical protein
VPACQGGEEDAEPETARNLGEIKLLSSVQVAMCASPCTPCRPPSEERKSEPNPGLGELGSGDLMTHANSIEPDPTRWEEREAIRYHTLSGGDGEVSAAQDGSSLAWLGL